jgi:TonB family protein
MGQRLAPTLDPAHTNERPELPGTLGSIIASLSLRLRILVLPDGSVLDAVIQKSTGEAEFDKLAIDWVKDNWRYLPATVNGRPIEAWTTVIVRFAAIH